MLPPHNPPLSWPPIMGCMLNNTDVPADTRHRPNVGPPSTRWPSIGPTLGRCLVFSGKQSWQQVSVRSQCYVTLTALSRHWRDAVGAGNTRECDNSVDGPTLLSVASHHDTLSLTRVSPRWWWVIGLLTTILCCVLIKKSLLFLARAKLRFLWERPDDFFFCGEPWRYLKNFKETRELA